MSKVSKHMYILLHITLFNSLTNSEEGLSAINI